MSETKVVTGPKTRFSYANVFEAKAGPQGGDPKYSTALLIPKTDKVTLDKIAAASAAALKQGKEKFGAAFGTGAFKKTPLRDGDEEKPDNPEYAGMMFLNASSKSRPQVVDKDVNPIMDQDEFYSGCYGRASINIYPYNNVSKGIGAGLNNVQKLEDGEKLGGGSTAAEDFGGFDDDDLG